MSHSNFLFLLLLLMGCTSAPYWEHTDPTWVAKEVQIHTVDASPWPGVQGWSLRDKVRGVCHIIIVLSAPNRECVLAHEHKHCKGWDHPKYRYNLACP